MSFPQFGRVTLCLAVLLAVAGCSYQGAIRRDFNRRASVANSAKLPFRLGIVESSEFLQRTFVQNGADRDMTIAVQPALADAIYAEMGKVFASAVRLTPAEMGASNADLLMFPTYTYSTIDSNRFFKTFTMKQELAYRFEDARTRKEVAMIESVDVLDYTQPAGARTAAIIGVASMFALTPITIPLETYALGEHAVEVVEASLRKLVQSQTDQLYVRQAALGEQR